MEGGDWKLCMVWVSITIAVLTQAYFLSPVVRTAQDNRDTQDRLDCPGSPGSFTASTARSPVAFEWQMGSVDPTEWVQCHSCGWWMPTESNDYVDNVFVGPYSSSLHRNCKWCESGDTLDRCSREHFGDCCGPKGFGPDDWFNCTECNKLGSWGKMCPTTTS